MLTWSDYLDGHTLLESGEECPYGCYRHQYGYGNTEVNVNIRGHKFIFGYSYVDNCGDAQAEWAAVEELFTPARACLIEDMRVRLGIKI